MARPDLSATWRGGLPRGLSRSGLLLPFLLFFSPQVLTSPTLPYYDEGDIEGPRIGPQGSTPDGCGGLFDICCYSSSLVRTVYGYAHGGVPLLPPGSTSQHSDGLSSTLVGQTWRLFRPLMSLAAGAWCSPAGKTARPAASASCTATQWWHQFSGIKYVFSFGDSYTTTEFKYTELPYPSPDSPLGNPPYPGRTSANGPNWIDYLTVRYNRSLVQTYNLAYGGATVDPDLVPPLLPSVLSLRGQIMDEFVPGYARHGAPGRPAWSGGDTLFAVWMGINDVNGAYARGPSGPDGTDALNRRIVREYAGLAGTLYDHGARNFALLNVPAIERSPLTRGRGAAAVALERAELEAFNGLLVGMARELKAERPDANVWVYDSYADFSTVMDNPGAFPQTSGYRNTTDFCDVYQNGTPERDTFDAACGVPVNQYLWLNSLHPTDPVHELVAARVADLLEASPNIC